MAMGVDVNIDVIAYRENPMATNHGAISYLEIGRGDWIRTNDPLHPMQVPYQTGPRPECGAV